MTNATIRCPSTWCAPVACPPQLPFRCWCRLLFDCCGIFIKWRSPKTKAAPLSLFFDASHFAPPSEHTNDSERKPHSLRPTYGVGEQRRHDLVVPLLYPWRVRAKPLVGRVSSLSCWLSCLCGCCGKATFSFYTGSKTKLAKPKWPTYAPSFYKICAQRQQIYQCWAQTVTIFWFAPRVNIVVQSIVCWIYEGAKSVQ